MADNMRLIKVGGICGIVLGVVQLAGIIMHGSIPANPVQGLEFIRNHPVWAITHIILIGSYLLVVGFYIGLTASFVKSSTLVQVGKDLILIGAFLGAVHFLLHLAIFPYAAERYTIASNTPLEENILVFYEAFYHYAHLLNRFSVFLMMAVAIMFSITMTRETHYRKWVGILGVAAAAATLATMFVVELFLTRATGDIVFAIALLPTIVWLVATGIVMLRIKLPAE
jgi:hypothetical protein